MACAEVGAAANYTAGAEGTAGQASINGKSSAISSCLNSGLLLGLCHKVNPMILDFFISSVKSAVPTRLPRFVDTSFYQPTSMSCKRPEGR